MAVLLDKLKEHYDLIIIDTPPINVVSDALVLTSESAGVVLVARQKQTTYEELNKAIDSLRFAKANIAGVVLTGVPGGDQAGFLSRLQELRLRIREGMSALTDSHCHFLPGVDDGAAAEEESLGILRLLREPGGGACNGLRPIMSITETRYLLFWNAARRRWNG